MYDTLNTDQDYRVLRTLSGYALTQLQNGFVVVYEDKQSDFISEFDAYHLETCETDEFLRECKELI